jgi:heme/copper-type cytochrome/quinol oxidase subunit 1
LTTNHKRLALLYFYFILGAGLFGLTLATVIRLELAYPGQLFITQNPERYLTVASLHGVIMVFFVVIPLIFGAFANFLLPLQLGVRDVAFPRLNSFMF